jgi:hypothetical protein
MRLTVTTHLFGHSDQPEKGAILQGAEIISLFSPLEPCLVGIEACTITHHWADLAVRHLRLAAKIEPLSVSDWTL